MATREQVLRAYANNPLAELNPSEDAISYWMSTGLENFDEIVNQVRSQNPDVARRIDAERAASSGLLTDQQANELVREAYADIGRTGVGESVYQIDPQGLAYWTGELTSGRITPAQFESVFGGAVQNYLAERPSDPYTAYVSQTQGGLAEGMTGPRAEEIVRNAYARIGRVGVGSKTNEIDPQGLAYWTGRLMSGGLTPDNFNAAFAEAVRNYISEKPEDRYTRYVSPQVQAGLLDDAGRFTPGGSFQIQPTATYNPFATTAPFGAGRFGAVVQPFAFTPPEGRKTIPTTPERRTALSDTSGQEATGTGLTNLNSTTGTGLLGVTGTTGLTSNLTTGATFDPNTGGVYQGSNIVDPISGAILGNTQGTFDAATGGVIQGGDIVDPITGATIGYAPGMGYDLATGGVVSGSNIIDPISGAVIGQAVNPLANQAQPGFDLNTGGVFQGTAIIDPISGAVIGTDYSRSLTGGVVPGLIDVPVGSNLAPIFDSTFMPSFGGKGMLVDFADYPSFYTGGSGGGGLFDYAFVSDK